MRIPTMLTLIFLCGRFLCVSGLSQAPTNSIAVSALLTDLIAENGGKTNKLPAFGGTKGLVSDVKKDQEGAQVIFAGNQMEALLAMLTSAYGKPSYVRTNKSGGKSMFQYNKNQLGVGLSCSLNIVKDGAITHLIILGEKGLASLRGTSEEKPAPAAKSREEIRAREIAIKAAIQRGYKGDLDAVASHTRYGWLVGVFEKSKGPFEGSVATVGLKNDFTLVVFDAANGKPE